MSQPDHMCVDAPMGVMSWLAEDGLTSALGRYDSMGEQLSNNCVADFL